MMGTLNRAGNGLRNTFAAADIRHKAGLAVGVLALTAATTVNAQTGTGSPPSLDPIDPIVDVDSVTSEVSSFGGTILLAWAALFIGFGLTYKLVRRLRGTA